MPIPILLSFLFYLGTLTATQTAHGGQFLSLRWVALGALTTISLVYWFLGKIPRWDKLKNHGAPNMVILYLCATLLSVATAENYIFSGLRWVTHAMLILTFMVFLRGIIDSRISNLFILFLKILTAGLLIVSFLFPAAPTIYENPYFRGAMGDSNSLGHVSAIAALLFVQGSITAREEKWRMLQFGVAVISSVVLISSWARSSMVAFLAGLVLINYYYRLTRPLLIKSLVFLSITFLLVSPFLQSVVFYFATKGKDKEFDIKNPAPIIAIIKGEPIVKGPTLDTVVETRAPLWSEAWEGFKLRPFLGWGFGANADIIKEWNIRPEGIGMTRDITNDLLFIMEGCGVVGLLGYLGLIVAIFRQSPTRRQIFRLRQEAERGLYLRKSALEASSLMFPPKKGNEGKKNNDEEWSLDHRHAILYILSISIFILFMFDCSAFSAGSFLSATFWVCTAAAGALRAEEVIRDRGRQTEDRRIKQPQNADRACLGSGQKIDRVARGA